jgi:hypothetical protein
VTGKCALTTHCTGPLACAASPTRTWPVNANVRQHMHTAWLKLSAAALLGLLAPLWWTLAVNQAAYAIYVMIGSPEKPTKSLLWGSVYAPSFILGVAAGVVATLLSARSPLKGWAAFFLSLMVSSLALGIYFDEPVEYLRTFYKSVGNSLFFAGSLLWPAIAHARRRAV